MPNRGVPLCPDVEITQIFKHVERVCNLRLAPDQKLDKNHYICYASVRISLQEFFKIEQSSGDRHERRFCCTFIPYLFN